MWISDRAKNKLKEEDKMKKREFDMDDEKITEYTSGTSDLVNVYSKCVTKNSEATIVPVEDTKKYMESQDTTMGFYSDDELTKSDVIYLYSARAIAFVKDLNMFRYRRHYLIRDIAGLFNQNSIFGATMTFNSVIMREKEKMMKDYNIDEEQYYMLAWVIMLKITDDYNRIYIPDFHQIMNSPDSLFHDWDLLIDKKDYKFYDIHKTDRSFSSYGYQIRTVKFNYDTLTHKECGVTMNIDLFNDKSNATHVDFNFDFSGIEVVTDNLDKINMIKGCY